MLKPKRLIKGRVRLEAAAFGRLCVETIQSAGAAVFMSRSRLRAAVC